MKILKVILYVLAGLGFSLMTGEASTPSDQLWWTGLWAALFGFSVKGICVIDKKEEEVKHETESK